MTTVTVIRFVPKVLLYFLDVFADGEKIAQKFK